MPKPTAVGLLIRHHRDRARLSRAALARMAHLSESTLKNIETGRHEPSRDTREALAVALEMPELAGVQSGAMGLLALTGPQALTELLKNYSAQALAEALRLARADLWALFSALFPASTALAQTMTTLDTSALAEEHRR